MFRQINLWFMPMVLLVGAVACAPIPTMAPEPTPVQLPTVSATATPVPTPSPSPMPTLAPSPLVIGASAMTSKHYNPLWLNSQPQFFTFPLILPALTWFDDTAQPVLDLASKVDLNADATVYTFTLPMNAAWSDGTPLTTKDVAFTYKLALDPAIKDSAWVNNFAGIKGAAQFQRGEAKEIDGIKIVDNQVIRFELKDPNAAFLFDTYLGILPSHIYSKVEPKDLDKDALADVPLVTSGPFDLVKYEPGVAIQLKKKIGYWGKSVSINEITVRLIDSNAATLSALQSGDLQLAPIPLDAVNQVRSLARMDVLVTKGIGSSVLHIDARTKDQIATLNKPRDQGGQGLAITRIPKPYVQDKRFRQALAYAIDKQAIIQTVVGGEAMPIYSPMFAPDWVVNPKLNKYDVNLAKAKSLLKDSGVTFDSKGTALWENKPIALIYLATANDEGVKLGQVLQQQLGQIGIRLDLKLVPTANFLQAAIDGEGDLIRNTGNRWGVDPSVSSLYYTCKVGWATLVMGYCNSKLDDLLARGAVATKSEERQKNYWDASALLNDDLPSLFLYAPNTFFAVNKNLTGVKPTADPNYLTWNIQAWIISK